MEHSRRSVIANRKEEIRLLLNVPESERNDAWKDAMLEAKKGLERALYDFVINGCSDSGHIRGAFPELSAYYDKESYELLDEKIRILSKIASSGVDCDYLSIDGIDDILEEKVDGVEARVFD